MTLYNIGFWFSGMIFGFGLRGFFINKEIRRALRSFANDLERMGLLHVKRERDNIIDFKRLKK